jgi:hypothetical protein
VFFHVGKRNETDIDRLFGDIRTFLSALQKTNYVMVVSGKIKVLCCEFGLSDWILKILEVETYVCKVLTKYI